MCYGEVPGLREWCIKEKGCWPQSNDERTRELQVVRAILARVHNTMNCSCVVPGGFCVEDVRERLAVKGESGKEFAAWNWDVSGLEKTGWRGGVSDALLRERA